MVTVWMITVTMAMVWVTYPPWVCGLIQNGNQTPHPTLQYDFRAVVITSICHTPYNPIVHHITSSLHHHCHLQYNIGTNTR